MQELTRRLRDAEDCRGLTARYVPEGWQPDVFAQKEGNPEEVIDDLLEDVEYDAVYARAAHLAPHYGPPQVRPRQRARGALRMERAEHLYFLKVLRTAAGLELAALRQVVEFGGGTGDVAAMLREAGFEGTHFVHDLPPMLLLQHHWHRYSAIASFLGEGLEQTAEAVRGHTVLESSLGHLAAHLDHAAVRDSLFLATWSFTEAAAEARRGIWPLVHEFGYMLFAFVDQYFEVNNSRYLQELVASDLGGTHSVVCWRPKYSRRPGRFYLVAVHRDLGRADCLRALGCGPHSLHSSLNV